METQNQCPDIPEFVTKLAKAAAGRLQRGGRPLEEFEDLVQDLILDVLEALGSPAEIASLTEPEAQKLIAAAFNRKRKVLYRERNERGRRDSMLADMGSGPAPFEPGAALRLDIRQASEDLTVRQRQIVSLLYLGLRRRDIAEELDITPAAVCCHIRRIKRAWERHGLGSHLYAEGR